MSQMDKQIIEALLNKIEEQKTIISELRDDKDMLLTKFEEIVTEKKLLQNELSKVQHENKLLKGLKDAYEGYISDLRVKLNKVLMVHRDKERELDNIENISRRSIREIEKEVNEEIREYEKGFLERDLKHIEQEVDMAEEIKRLDTSGCVKEYGPKYTPRAAESFLSRLKRVISGK